MLKAHEYIAQIFAAMVMVAVSLSLAQCSQQEPPRGMIPWPAVPTPTGSAKHQLTKLDWNAKIFSTDGDDGLFIASSQYQMLQYGDLMQRTPHVTDNSWRIDRVDLNNSQRTVFAESARSVTDYGITNDFYKHTILDFLVMPCSGDLIAVGSTWGTDPGGYNHDWWIRRFSSNGLEDTARWAKRFSAGDWGIGAPFAISRDSLSNIYVAGIYSTRSGQDWWIKKFDPQGNEDTVRWNLKLDANNGHDVAYAMTIDSTDNLYIAGSARNLAAPDSYDDWSIRKFDAQGNEDLSNWNKTFDGGRRSDAVRAIATDGGDNLYAVGFAERAGTNTTARYGLVKKFAPDGTEDTINWNKKIPEFSELTAIYIDKSGIVYVGGIAAKGAFVLGFDANGREIFSANFAAGDWAIPKSILMRNALLHLGGYTCCQPDVQAWYESVPLQERVK